ncbi:hypothetical protein TSAR_014211 [Trichomalopsis sarcophagae]|uniref:Uncharacterized protein n=1 Tax=Trichomalopsis sarcophagae TaxID=543379 RepID=A0A232EH70_9HYME|nr:hypothetical protein TSAR_014211 [Trichomalopsis sarcophagae]
MRWRPWRDDTTSALQTRGSRFKTGFHDFFVALFTFNTSKETKLDKYVKIHGKGSQINFGVNMMHRLDISSVFKNFCD